MFGSRPARWPAPGPGEPQLTRSKASSVASRHDQLAVCENWAASDTRAGVEDPIDRTIGHGQRSDAGRPERSEEMPSIRCRPGIGRGVEVRPPQWFSGARFDRAETGFPGPMVVDRQSDNTILEKGYAPDPLDRQGPPKTNPER